MTAHPESLRDRVIRLHGKGWATKLHAHRHALRVMTKALVLDLWRVWHGFPPRQRECAEPAEPAIELIG